MNPHRRRSDYLVLVAVTLAALLAAGFMIADRLSQSASTADHALILSQRANLNHLRAEQALALARQQQQERNQAILISCREQNERHRATVLALRRLVAGSAKHASTPAQRARLKEGQKNTLLLINALAPERNCQKYLARLSQGFRNSPG